MKKGEAGIKFLCTYSWIILVILLVGILIYAGITTKKTFNPEIHECEEWGFCKEGSVLVFRNNVRFGNEEGVERFACFDGEFFSYSKTIDEVMKPCLSFRDKTPEELAVDWCNNNPQDSVNCTCEEEFSLEVLGEVVEPCTIYGVFYEKCHRGIWVNKSVCVSAVPKTEKEEGCPVWMQEYDASLPEKSIDGEFYYSKLCDYYHTPEVTK